ALVLLDRRQTTDDGRRTTDNPCSHRGSLRITCRLSSVVCRPLIALGFALTMLGHYGMMLATLAIMATFAVWATIETVRGRRTREGWMLLGLFAGAGAVGFALYYRFFVAEMWNQLSSVFRRLFGERASTVTLAPASQPEPPPSPETLPARVVRKVGE